MKEWGIKTRVLSLTMLPTMFIALLLGAYFTSTRLHEIESTLIEKGYAIALQLAPNSEYGIFSGDTDNLQTIVNGTFQEPDIVAVSIYNNEGKLLAEAGHTTHKPKTIRSVTDRPGGITMADTGETLIFTIPVTLKEVVLEDFPDEEFDKGLAHPDHNENVIGWINLEIGRVTTRLKEHQVFLACSIIMLLGLVISGIFAYRMGREVTQPILEILRSVEKIKDGNLDTRVHLNSRGELRHLEDGINTMAASLKAAHEEMQQSVEQATADLRQTLETIEIQNIELEMARKEAETASRVKSEFLANMSHEIRTPLNGVIGFINLLYKTELTNRQHDYISTIRKSAISLMSIINDILDFSKMEAGKLQLDHVPMELSECIEDALTIMAPSAHEKGLELIPLIYDDVPTQVVGDPLRLKQIITNLVSNAIKFTEKGSIIVRVMLEKDEAERVQLCVSVTDTGIGLTQEEQTRLFQAFSQADPTMTRKYGGTGLGLVISKRLVRQMQGEIGVESELNKGSTFWFTFAADKVNQQDSIPNDYTRLMQKKAVIFDNNETTALSLKHVLNSFHIKVTSLKHIQHAKNYFERKHKPDVLIVGINQWDEWPSVSSICESISKMGIPTILLLNNTEESYYETALTSGIRYCIAKPICKVKLYDVLCQHLDPNVATTPSISTDTPTDLNISLKILVVDDNKSNLKLLSAMFESLSTKIQITCVDSAAKALRAADTMHYDLIFMDIQMPKMDGIEATHRLRTKDGYKKTPIIAVTAHALVTERKEFLDAGMNDCLTKPVNEDELINMLKKWYRPLFPISPTFTGNQSYTYMGQTTKTIAAQLSSSTHKIKDEIYQKLLLTLEEDSNKINAYHAQDDLKAMRFEVHRLHGACCYCNVPPLKSAVAKLEHAIAQNERKDIEKYLQLFNNKVRLALKQANPMPLDEEETEYLS